MTKRTLTVEIEIDSDLKVEDLHDLLWFHLDIGSHQDTDVGLSAAKINRLKVTADRKAGEDNYEPYVADLGNDHRVLVSCFNGFPTEIAHDDGWGWGPPTPLEKAP